MARRRDPERFDQLVEAAVRAFVANGGFSRTSIDDVARELGVAKGTVYLYVQSKEALFDLCLRRADASDATVAALRTALRLAALEGARLAASPDLDETIVERYGLHPDDVAAWSATLRWALDPTDLASDRIAAIRDRAAAYDLVPADLAVAALIG